MKRSLLVGAAAAALSGCGLIYTNVKAPYVWRASTPAEVKTSPSDEVVTGKACSYSALYLVAWGDSGYAAAAADALKGRDAVLYDVKTDVKVTAALVGLYSRACTTLTARVGKL